ncbi:MAG: alpha/beta fold hydrolase [Methylocystis sp.]
MDPWQVWTWPWLTTMELYRRALEPTSVGAGPPAEADWTTPNRVTLDLATLRLRDFSTATPRGRPVLVVAPFTLHDAALADLAPGHSLIESLLANDRRDVFLIEWKSATAATRMNTIDTQFAALNVVVDELGPPVDLIGLCQGGWLSLAYAARFPSKIRRLVLVGAPVDTAAAPSAFSGAINPMTAALLDDMIRRGEGLALGRDMAGFWPRPADKSARALEALELEPPGDESGLRAIESFARWDARLLDLPGPYHREAFNWLYRENRLASGRFHALGRNVDLRRLEHPLFLLAGERDDIAPPAQVFAAAALVGTRESDIETALAARGHLALFMGARTITTQWPRIAKWLSE